MIGIATRMGHEGTTTPCSAYYAYNQLYDEDKVENNLINRDVIEFQ